MKLLLALTLLLNFNLNTNYNTNPPLIDAYIQAYNIIYNYDKEPKKDFIILDTESIYFVDTTYQERQQLISSFNKYNKTIINSSLFKLKEIGLVNKNGTILINGDLLMITNVSSNEDNSLIIEGSKYHSSTAAYFYKVTLRDKDGIWEIQDIQEQGVA